MATQMLSPTCTEALSSSVPPKYLRIIIITFILIQEKGFTESLLNWKTSTGPNSAQLPFLHAITWKR